MRRRKLLSGLRNGVLNVEKYHFRAQSRLQILVCIVGDQ